MLEQNKKELETLTKELKFSAQQAEQFSKYIHLLEQWNQRTNLISRNDVSSIVSKHIRESLQILSFNILNGKKNILDLGTGAGFPGIPISILNTHLDIALVDSKKIKTLFLQEVVDTLNLYHVRVICQRIEDLKDVDYIQKYDVILARAVSQLKDLWLWSEPLLQQEGVLVSYKGGDIDKEINELEKNCTNIELEIYPFQGPGGQENKKLVVATRQVIL